MPDGRDPEAGRLGLENHSEIGRGNTTYSLGKVLIAFEKGEATVRPFPL